MVRQLFALLFISIASLTSVALLQNKLITDELSQRESRLEKIHADALTEFNSSVYHFASLMSGVRSYLHHADSFPSQEELYHFLYYQLEQLSFHDSLVVSFLDTDHTFIYSFTRAAINPDGLVGKSVNDFRNDQEIDRLNALLESDSILAFQPINLVEGWVGIPLNFRVKRNGEVLGYIASIVDFRSIIAPIDQLVDSKDFVLKFEFAGDTHFDRERVHDGSTVYHDQVDTLSAEFAQVDEKNWVTSKSNLFGQDFSISTAYRHPHKSSPYLQVIFILLYVLIVGFSVWSIYKAKQTERLNLRLAELNRQMGSQNEELQLLNNTKDRFFSIIGHDLRSPLATISSLMNMVGNEDISNNDAKELLAKLGPATQGSIDLLEDLLNWARINNNEIRFSPEMVNVDALIGATTGLLQPNAELKSITIEKHVDAMPVLNLDRNMLSTVIRNLLGNAIKFSPIGSRISISASIKDERLVVAIQDFGMGLTEHEVSKIKDLTLSSKTGTAGEQGSGLGLTISSAFIKQHGGELIIKSKKDVGSTFSVVIPITEKT